MNNEPQKTPLYSTHIEMGAKMVDFAGYWMPVRYTSLQEEHMSVRNSVGVFDVSHMGEFMIKGPQALDLVQHISSNDASTLIPGKAQYSCMPNQEGGIVDDLIIYCISPEQYMLVVNAANIKKDFDWIERHNTYDCTLKDHSDSMGLIAVQGPRATELLQHATDIDLKAIPYYGFTEGKIFGLSDIIISATGYTGSGGFELYVPNGHLVDVWSGIFALDTVIDVLPAGLGARDTLRLEMGYCLYGNDINDVSTPIEAGLSWITKLNHDFVGSDMIRQIKEKGVNKKLVGFKMEDKGIPRAGYDILNQDDEVIGTVTSGTLSPMLQSGVGLGYVDIPYHKKETPIKIGIRKKKVAAKVSRPPFVNLK